MDGPEQPRYVIIWDNASFHWAALVRNWSTAQLFFICHHILNSSALLRSVFQLGVGRYINASSNQCIPLLQAMAEPCSDTIAEAYQGWTRHARRYFPHCLARGDTACDVEVLWPNRNKRRGAARFSFLLTVYAEGLYSFFNVLFCMKKTLQIQLHLPRCT